MNQENIILSVDIGTTETKSILMSCDPNIGLIDVYNHDSTLIFPKTGWVEQRPEILADSIYLSIRTLIDRNQVRVPFIRGLVFTSAMQGILPLDDNNEPLYNMITWLDTRAAQITNDVMLKGWLKIAGFPVKKLYKFLKITGGAPGSDGKNTLCKSFWIKQNLPDVYNRTKTFIDTKDYAVYLATNKIVTSIDMAYVSWLMDTRDGKMDWSPEICAMYDLDHRKYPKIEKSTDIIGKITKKFSEKTGLPLDALVVNGAGDLLTSAIGSGAIQKGELHANIGTAGWVGCHFHKKIKDIPHYTGTIAAGIPDKYLILSKQETIGGTLDWIKNIFFPAEENPDFINSELYTKIDKIVQDTEPGSKKLIFTPWLMGERSPVNDGFLRASFMNLSLNHTRSEILRAIYEGVAYNLRWGIDVVEKLSSKKQDFIRIIGGGSKSDVWCQIFADVWGKRVIQIENPQSASAIGGAIIAMVSLNYIEDFEKSKKFIRIKNEFIPQKQTFQIYNQIFKEYKGIYKRNRELFHNLNKNPK